MLFLSSNFYFYWYFLLILNCKIVIINILRSIFIYFSKLLSVRRTLIIFKHILVSRWLWNLVEVTHLCDHWTLNMIKTISFNLDFQQQNLSRLENHSIFRLLSDMQTSNYMFLTGICITPHGEPYSIGHSSWICIKVNVIFSWRFQFVKYNSFIVRTIYMFLSAKSFQVWGIYQFISSIHLHSSFTKIVDSSEGEVSNFKNLEFKHLKMIFYENSMKYLSLH